MPPYENLKCPECGGEMISRKSQFGVFWGCKAFPRCKGTRDSEGRSKQDKWNEERKEIESQQDPQYPFERRKREY